MACILQFITLISHTMPYLQFGKKTFKYILRGYIFNNFIGNYLAFARLQETTWNKHVSEKERNTPAFTDKVDKESSEFLSGPNKRFSGPNKRDFSVQSNCHLPLPGADRKIIFIIYIMRWQGLHGKYPHTILRPYTYSTSQKNLPSWRQPAGAAKCLSQFLSADGGCRRSAHPSVWHAIYASRRKLKAPPVDIDR